VWTGNVAHNLLDDIYTSQLNETQRKLLLAFSVYREPVSLSAARALCDFAETVSLAQVHAALDALLAQHLLQAVGDGSYQLHAIVDSYAHDTFVAHDEQANELALCAAHGKAAHYYLDLAAQALSQQGRREQLSDYDPLTEAAWQFCQARQWQDAYELIEREKLFANLKALGGLAIVLELYKLLLPLKKWQAEPRNGARVYNRLGSIYRSLGRRELSLQYLEQASALCKESDEKREASWTLNHLGRLYASMGEKERARSYYEEALTQARAIDEPLLEGAALNNLGLLYSAWGQKEQEQKYYTEALAVYRELGDPKGEAATLNNLGRVAEDLGDSEQAQKYYIEGLNIFRKVRDRRSQGWSLNNLGHSCILAGEPERARTYLEEALRIRRKVDRKG
ncbi:MAG: tetratricopeptide repeat protein, partial [Ktedonobacteraceae bacterium]